VAKKTELHEIESINNFLAAITDASIKYREVEAKNKNKNKIENECRNLLVEDMNAILLKEECSKKIAEPTFENKLNLGKATSTSHKLTVSELCLMLQTMKNHKDPGGMVILSLLFDTFSIDVTSEIEKTKDIDLSEVTLIETMKWNRARSNTSKELNDILSDGIVKKDEFTNFSRMLRDDAIVANKLRETLKGLYKRGVNIFKHKQAESRSDN